MTMWKDKLDLEGGLEARYNTYWPRDRERRTEFSITITGQIADLEAHPVFGPMIKQFKTDCEVCKKPFYPYGTKMKICSDLCRAKKNKNLVVVADPEIVKQFLREAGILPPEEPKPALKDRARK